MYPSVSTHAYPFTHLMEKTFPEKKKFQRYSASLECISDIKNDAVIYGKYIRGSAQPELSFEVDRSSYQSPHTSAISPDLYHDNSRYRRPFKCLVFKSFAGNGCGNSVTATTTDGFN